MEPKTYTIDATNRPIGRVASEAAHALMGKRQANFAKNEVADVKVVIENAKKLFLTESRAKAKVYSRYTGYPGGFFETTMKDTIIRKGIEHVVRKTVDGMIPRNKLRAKRMKNLIVHG